jgi:desampylase
MHSVTDVGMDAQISRADYDRLIWLASLAQPFECCGLLLGRQLDAGLRIEQVVPAANIAPDPRHQFEIDPAALIAAHKAARSGGPGLLGWYHSHPTGLAEPSLADRQNSHEAGKLWLIIAGNTVRAFLSDTSDFHAAALRITD